MKLLTCYAMHAYKFIENAGEARLTNIFVGKVFFLPHYNSPVVQCSAEEKTRKRNAHQVLRIYACDEFYISIYSAYMSLSIYSIAISQNYRTVKFSTIK